jgi:hypothetical protein
MLTICRLGGYVPWDMTYRTVSTYLVELNENPIRDNRPQPNNEGVPNSALGYAAEINFM